MMRWAREAETQEGMGGLQPSGKPPRQGGCPGRSIPEVAEELDGRS